MEIGKDIFFGHKDLKDYTYIFHLPSMLPLDRHQLSNRINSLGGNVTFCLSESTILVIQNREILKLDENLRGEISRYEKIILFKDANIEILKDKNNLLKKTQNVPTETNCRGKLFRILLLADLLNILSHMESKTLEIHYKNGLPRTSDKNSIISVVNLNEDNKKAKFFSFGKVRSDSQKYNFDGSTYDIPKYYAEVPQGFSLFMSYDEKEQIDFYIQKNPDRGVKKPKVEQEDKNVNDVPLPRKEHNFCHMCISRFDDYLTHINSFQHITNVKSNKNLFDEIEKTFTRIRNIQKEKEINSELDIIINKNIFSFSNNLQSTKQDTNYKLNKESNALSETHLIKEELSTTVYLQDPQIKDSQKFLPKKKCFDGNDIQNLNEIIETETENTRQAILQSLKLINRKRNFSDFKFSHKGMENLETQLSISTLKNISRASLISENKKDTFTNIGNRLKDLRKLMKNNTCYNIK